MKYDRVNICAGICEALIAQGIQPTVRAVHKEWVTRYVVAPSFRDILPPFRKWMGKRRNSRRVKAFVKAYCRLDPVERDAVHTIMEQLDKGNTDALNARA